MGTLVVIVAGKTLYSGDGQPSRAVGNMGSGGPRVSGARSNRFDHDVEFVGTVDIAAMPQATLGRMSRAFEKSRRR